MMKKKPTTGPAPKTRVEQIFDALPTAEKMDAGDIDDIGTAAWLARAIGVQSNSIGRGVRRLRDEGRAHIKRWTDECSPRAMWVSGPGADAPAPRMTPEEAAQRRRDVMARYFERRDEREAAGEYPSDRKLTPTRELTRTLSTVERARAVPHSWLTPLAELQAGAVQMTPPVRKRGNAREQQA